MLEIPKRQSLIAQAADALRDGIHQGLWQTHLPGERVVCTQLQISRPTLRAALDVLQREGLIKVRQGKLRSIVQGVAAPPDPEQTTVAVLSELPLHRMPQNSMFYIHEMRDHLRNAKVNLEIVFNARLQQKRPAKLLEQIVLPRQASCWILLSCTEAVQEWFHQSGIHALAAGSCFPGIRLPSLDVDYRAVCRHASGILLSKGHRHQALLLPDSPTAGDMASKEGFNEAIQQSKLPDASGTVVLHDGSREMICRKLDQILRLKDRPTGLIVCRPIHVISVVSHLYRRGLRLPEDMAIISRDNDPYLSMLTPEISRYAYRRRDFAQRLAKLTIRLATTGSLPVRHNMILPKFEVGDSTG